MLLLELLALSWVVKLVLGELLTLLLVLVPLPPWLLCCDDCDERIIMSAAVAIRVAVVLFFYWIRLALAVVVAAGFIDQDQARYFECVYEIAIIE